MGAIRCCAVLNLVWSFRLGGGLNCGPFFGGLGTVMYRTGYSCKQTKRNELDWIEFAGLGERVRLCTAGEHCPSIISCVALGWSPR